MRWWFSVILLGVALPALAQDPSAEHRRLQGELRKLAQKAAWSGVDRTYVSMVDLGIQLDPNDHLQAAQAAIARGDALLAMLRFRRVIAQRPPPDAPEEDHVTYEDARSALERLETRYGPVSISVGEGRQPVLLRPSAPFAPDERTAVEQATQRLAEERVFRGLLPVGEYEIDGRAFEVMAGTFWHPVVLAAPQK